MTLRVTVPTSYIHERYLGRPSCPKCGELLMNIRNVSTGMTSVMSGCVTNAIMVLKH